MLQNYAKLNIEKGTAVAGVARIRVKREEQCEKRHILCLGGAAGVHASLSTCSQKSILSSYIASS